MFVDDWNIQMCSQRFVKRGDYARDSLKMNKQANKNTQAGPVLKKRVWELTDFK